MAAQLLGHVAYSVLYHGTGKPMNYGQLRKHPKFQETRNKSFSNEIGRLCQGVGTGKNGLGKIVEGTDTFYVINFEDIPKYCMNKICYTSVVCEVKLEKITQIVHESQSVAPMSDTPGTLAPTQHHYNYSSS